MRGIRAALEALAAPKPAGPKLDKDTQAVALMLTMANPTLAAIAEALGYKSHTAMRRLPKFCAAWKKFAIMRTVTGGNGRSMVRGEDEIGDDE